MSDRPHWLESLSPQQRELLARRLKQRATSTLSPIVPQPRQDGQEFPLSFAQQRLWFWEQWQPGTAAYYIPLALELTGNLDVPIMQRCLQQIGQRHETLRTCFKVDEGSPVQQVQASLPLTLPLLDLQALPLDQRPFHARQIMFDLSRRPFDLVRGPPWYLYLLRLQPQHHILFINMHHLVSDGWSLGVLIQELSEFYNAAVDGRSPSLPPLSLQYVDYALWQQQALSGDTLAKQIQYWKKQLADIPASIDLPTDFPRPLTQTFRGARVATEIPAPLVHQLEALGRVENSTLFMVLLAIFQTVLHRYTGQKTIAVGSPIANRQQPEIKNLIGFFVNTLVLPTTFQGSPTFRQLLGRVRDVALGAYAYQDVPFEKLVEELKPARDPARPPLFQVMLTFQNIPTAVSPLSGLEIEPIEIDSGVTKFDLTLNVINVAGGLQVTLEYNADLFKQATAQRMLGHIYTLLEGVAADPDRPLGTYGLLLPAEQDRLLRDFNNTQTPYPNTCLHRLFEAQAARTPERTAVFCRGQKLSYRMLNHRANQLAHYLLEQGIRPEQSVGIYIERSLDMVVALLGILKAGATYLPINTTFPSERVAAIVADAAPSLIITHQHLVPALPAESVLCCLDTNKAIAKQNGKNTAVEVISSQAAYVLYTSGSTGNPKGVVVEHGQLANYVHAAHSQLELAPVESFALVQPLAVDSCHTVIFPALCFGKQLHILPRADATDAEAVSRYFQQHRIDCLKIAPTHLAALGNAAEFPERLMPHQRLVIGGEASNWPDVSAWRALAPGCRLFNHYGPTEATVGVLTHEVADIPPRPEAKTVPIGRPLPNTGVYILDSYFQPVPVGVPGELYIGGSQVARGYLNKPGETAVSFIPNPFTNNSGHTRLYRTGDLARHLPGGHIEFLGRVDHQVKIRGYRVELNEIETILQTHTAVREAVVILSAAVASNPQLVAYITPQPGQTPESQRLRQFLLQKLPDYMVPASYVVLEALPRTPHGKLDHRRLQTLTPQTPAASVTYVPPRSPTEESLVQIWSALLDKEPIGIHDNFFDLGGHSLLATQVISQIRRLFQIELPVPTLFELATIAELAQKIDADSRSAVGLQAPPILPIDRERPMPLSFAQQRLWFLDRLEPGSPFYNIPAAIRLEGRLNVAALEQSWQEIVRRHEVLRTTFGEVEGTPLQSVQPHLSFALPVIDLSQLSQAQREKQAQALTRSMARTAFDLSQGPLFRAALLRLEPENHLMLLTMHHIVSDGWSTGILLREVAALYRAFAAGYSSPLPPLEIQYADFAHWQRQWLQGPTMARQIAYWREKLGPEVPVLQLPTDRPRPPVQTFRGARLPVQFHPPHVADLRALCRQQDVTLFMALLAIFKVLLSRYIHQTDIVVGTPIANRSRAEIEDLIGFFVNTLVLRTDLAACLTFSELLQRIRHTTLEAYLYQDLPFEKLVEEIQPERDLGRNPLFQVMFALQNMPLPALELPGLRLSRLEQTSQTAKFDLGLDLMETPEGLVGWIEYSTELYDEATIARLASHYQTLLAALVANPDQPLSHLPLLPADEQHQLITWSQGESPPAPPTCLHHLFEQQAQRSPQAIALRQGQRQLSYAALDQQANRLAHYLQQQGVGPQKVVALWLPRTPEQVIAILAVLKAGGTYLPLPLDDPPDRLRALLADTQPQLCLSLSQQQPAWQSLATQVPLLCLDQCSLVNLPPSPPAAAASPAHAAYLMFTSGSTGRPKGVAVPHQAIANRVRWGQAAYRLTPDDRFLQTAAYTFDISLWEFLAPLVAGATLVLLPHQGQRDLPLVAQLLCREAITAVHFVPSLLQLLCQEPGFTALPHLRLLFCGGERVPASLVEQLHALTSAQIHQFYGPTEAAISVTAAHCRPYEPLSLGRPIHHADIYLLDAHFNLVPQGVPGELFIGGICLAQGYLHQPAQTAERFVPNPFARPDPATGQVPSGQLRLYRTGDLARWLPDGRLQFLGRIDHQVKIRGHRVEPDEIQAALLAHPAIQEALVLPFEDPPGEIRLIAYITTEQPELTDGAIRSFLQQTVPDYMIPAVIVRLDAFPLTRNGKIDRQALPPPAQTRPIIEAKYAAPRNMIEKQLVAIWSDVMRLEQVGIHDNYFELGGDSLLSIQIVARARQMNLLLKVKDIFQYQTVAELAEVAGNAKADYSLPLSPAQQQLFHLHATHPRLWNQVVVLSVKKPMKVLQFEQAITHIVAHHEALRLAFVDSPSGWQQILLQQPVIPPVTWIDLQHLPEGQIEATLRALAEQMQTSLPLWQGPPLHLVFLGRGLQGDSYLLIAAHHLVMDSAAWGILLEDLQTAYQQSLEGRPVKLPPASSFAQWVRELSHLSPLADATYEQKPPTPLEVTSVALSSTETETLLTSLKTTRNLKITDVLLAALAQTLTKWQKESQILMNILYEYRESLPSKYARTLGYFDLLLPVVIRLPLDAQPKVALRSAKEQLHLAMKQLTGDPSPSTAPAQQAAVTLIYEPPTLAPEPFEPVMVIGKQFNHTHPHSSLIVYVTMNNAQLQVIWKYDSHLYQPALVARLAASFLKQLQLFTRHLPETQITPSDFPQARLSQKELNKLISIVNRTEREK